MPFMMKLPKSHRIFLQYLIGYTYQPYSVWEGTTQKYEYHEMRIVGLAVDYCTCQIPCIF